MSTAEIMMNSEKVMLAKYILSIDDEETLSKVKNRLAIFMRVRPNNAVSPTEQVLNAIAKGWEDDRTAEEMVEDTPGTWANQFSGKWIDSRNADEMIAEIRNSRTQNTIVEL